MNNNIRKKRIEAGISVKDLSEKIGKRMNYIYMMERGERTPSIGTTMKLAEVLDCEIGDLFGKEV